MPERELLIVPSAPPIPEGVAAPTANEGTFVDPDVVAIIIFGGVTLVEDSADGFEVGVAPTFWLNLKEVFGSKTE